MNVYKRNYFIYFYVYFVVQVIFIYINVFLPVYFFNILQVNRTELAFIQFFAYLALFIKPIIAIYVDRESSIPKRKIMIVICSLGTLISFMIFILNLNYLMIFGIFLGINIACTSIMDVAIDKIIVDSSPDEKIKDRNALYTQLGSIAGAIFPNIVFYVTFTDLYSIPTWYQFFIIGVFSIFPIIFIGLILKSSQQVIIKSEIETDKEVNLKTIVLMCIILFLFYGERIYEYPLEPWILNKYGEEYFSLFILLLVLLIIINALGLILGGIISNKLDRKKLLIICSFIYGILLIIVPFTDIITFFILFGIMQIVSGIIVINLISLMIGISHKKVVYFQVMATFVIIAFVIFIPLGTFLSQYIETEFIIVIAGVLKLLSVIPIYFIEYKYEKNKS
ncbi:MAG: MFS transporter [Promethearchaeota archaeon]